MEIGKSLFVIIGIDHDKPREKKFLGLDSESGGYYWNTSLTNAKIFDEFKEAEKVILSSDFTYESKTYDGTIYPPRLIHSIANINNIKPKGSATIGVQRIDFTNVFSEIKIGEIKKPKSCNY